MVRPPASRAIRIAVSARWSPNAPMGNERFQSQSSIERSDTPPERLDVLPYLGVVAPLLLIEILPRGQRQIGLQIAQGSREVVQVIREQPSIAQLVERRWIDREQQLCDI